MVSDNPQEQQNQEVHEASRRHMFGHCGNLKVQEAGNTYQHLTIGMLKHSSNNIEKKKKNQPTSYCSNFVEL